MPTNSRRRFMPALLIALFTACVVASPLTAAAVDLTGTWSGKAVCKGFFAGSKTSDTFVDTGAQISQSGADLNMVFFGASYNGAAQDNATNAKKAEGTFIACSTVNDYSAYGEIGAFSVTLNLNDDTKTTFKATSTFFTGTDNFQTCTYTFKRTDPSDPGVGGCSLATAQ